MKKRGRPRKYPRPGISIGLGNQEFSLERLLFLKQVLTERQKEDRHDSVAPARNTIRRNRAMAEIANIRRNAQALLDKLNEQEGRHGEVESSVSGTS